MTGEIGFDLAASVDDCMNCIEDEIIKLNELVGGGRTAVVGVTGFFVDETRPTTARRFIAHLSPAPRFPISVENTLAGLPEATTPPVLVIRSRDRKILDARKPLPQNFAKRDAFYARWDALMGSQQGDAPDGGEPFVSEVQ